MFSAFLSSYRNTRESLGELEEAVETMARNFGHENRACAYFTANMAAKHSKSLYDINKTK